MVNKGEVEVVVVLVEVVNEVEVFGELFIMEFIFCFFGVWGLWKLKGLVLLEGVYIEDGFLWFFVDVVDFVVFGLIFIVLKDLVV